MNERTAILRRMFVVFGLLLLLPTLVVLQLFRINVAEGENLRELWNNQAISEIPVPAQRGNIYDVNGSILATNSVDYKLSVDPLYPATTREDLTLLSKTLSEYTGRPANFYLNRIQSAPTGSRYVVLERNIDVTANDAVRDLDIPGVIFEEEYKRNYSFGSLAAHLLGFVNYEMAGMIGLEKSYNDVLEGEDGLQTVRRDRLNNISAYVGAPRKQPVQGHSLHTTINSYIQAILEEELEAGIETTGAKYGTGIIVDPKTGQIKAMANFPTFDPNNINIEEDNRRNYAVADMIEPGSTFKLVTAIAALEQGVTTLKEVFETPESGRKLIHGQWMEDHDPLGSLTFTEVFAQSSNVATSEMAMRLSPEVFYQYARNLGFGVPTTIDLPNEEAGRLQKPFEWSLVTLPWMSVGYEVQATPIQLLQAYAAFGNKGLMMRPYVVDHVTDEFGDVVLRNKPMEVRQIAKRETIDKLIPVFEEVVTDSGTAQYAAVDGLRIAGKTGTAQKYIDGQYRFRYRATFTGFFPSDDPTYAMIIILDEPTQSIYGGYTAGQIFREVATRIAGLDSDIRQKLTPDLDALDPVNWALAPSVTGLTTEKAKEVLRNQKIVFEETGRGRYVIEQSPAAGDSLKNKQIVRIALGDAVADSVAEGYVKVPDVREMSMRQATTLLAGLGLNIEMDGSGTIYSQFPLKDELMQIGRTVTVRGRSRPLQQTTVTLTSTN